MRQGVLLLSVPWFLAVSCVGESASDAGPELTEVGDVLFEDKSIPPAEVVEDSFDFRGLDLGDVAPVDVGPTCEGGTGCFLDPCEQNSDCLSGWCVQHAGQTVCTMMCQEDCAPGWKCKEVSWTYPDLLFVCISDVQSLCRPCADSDDCVGDGGKKDACIPYGEAGSFCGGPCSQDGTCPDGYSCKEALSTEGETLQQCVHDGGECPCNALSVAQALSTPCDMENEWGLCAGKRTCTEQGLSACSASMPAPEACNTVDDDCDGDVDEDTCDDDSVCTVDSCEPTGECKHVPTDSECDDGNPCTDDACDTQLGCVNTPNALACNDNNECTLGDACAGGECIPGVALGCDDGNPCTTDACEPASGCTAASNSALCDDNDACTLGDTCADGACVPGGPFPCDDDNGCTDDYCEPGAGGAPVCKHSFNSAPCAGGKTCVQGACECVPDCTGKECGPDGCGGTCTKSFPFCEMQGGVCQGAKKNDTLCVNGLFIPCGEAQYYWNDPAFEQAENTCDFLDNDCDGFLDEDLGTTTCGAGACLHTVNNCKAGVPQVCDPLQGKSAEVCDGVDNDCNTIVDDGLGSTSCGLGPCAHTQPNCVGGVPTACNPLLGAVPEMLDGIDNDCDGGVDEDFPVPGALIITEYMADPKCTADAAGEWFEIYNPGMAAWDINGWTIKDKDVNVTTIAVGKPLVVEPGKYVVLARTDKTTNGNVPADYVYNGNKFELANTEDEIQLVGPGGITVDEVAWTSSGWPAVAGKSAALKTTAYTFQANDLGANWVVSAALISGGCGDFGSPGAPNP